MCVRFARPLFVAALLLLLANAAQAQFLGHNFPGDAGLLAASQPDPGIYIAPLYIGYRGDTLRDKNGNAIAIDPERQGSLNVNAFGLGFWHVTGKTLFGGGPAEILPGLIGKNRGYGFGPEVTLPLATSKTLFGFLNVRTCGKPACATRSKATRSC